VIEADAVASRAWIVQTEVVTPGRADAPMGEIAATVASSTNAPSAFPACNFIRPT